MADHKWDPARREPLESRRDQQYISEPGEDQRQHDKFWDRIRAQTIKREQSQQDKRLGTGPQFFILLKRGIQVYAGHDKK